MTKKNIKKDILLPLAKGVLKKTPVGRGINIASKGYKAVKDLSKAIKKGKWTKEDKKDIAAVTLASSPTLAFLGKAAIDEKKQKKIKKKKIKQQEKMGDIEYEIFDKNKQKYKKVKKAEGGLIVASMYNKDK